MDERILFDRFHEALDAEPRPGAYDRLRIALAKSPVKAQRRPLAMRWSRTGLRLAAVMTIAVLAIAAAVALLATHRVADRITPADSDHAITAYKLMVSNDYEKIQTVGINSTCYGNQFAACETDANLTLPVANQFQNDLNRFQTPARFAVADAQLRRHNARQISRLNALLAASRAQDATGVDRAVAAVYSGRAWLNAMLTSILRSREGTVITYVASVRYEKQALDTCADCQDLAGQDQIGCAGNQTSGCQALVENAAAQVTSFQTAVVVLAAPSSLAAKDNRLQRDLANADNAVVTMAEALSAGDQAGFDTGRITYQQAMAAVNRDAADILNG